ncbi:MAG: AAA family ATPase [Rikenellaceae bacterium]|nr:AAA family ATPase [Rikenellaceae bacterium]MCL2692761.1 AAA family ATPase [Rikenellaceae bacterium]
MLNDFLASQIYKSFGFAPTFGQKKTIEKISAWLADPEDGSIFLLNGYAGTGKTTLIAALVAALKELKISFVLLAPTGRAAKVVAQYTGEKSSTIHKKIYRQKSSDIDAGFALDFNKDTDTLYIVDEGSMIGDTGSGSDRLFGTGSLLEDLVSYVRAGKRCRLLVAGDEAQLPPIGHDFSPALDVALMSRYGTVESSSLDEVVRQQAESGILFNATLVRCMIEAQIYEPPLFRTDGFTDVRRIEGGEFLEEIEGCYSRYGRDQTIVITRSNKRAGRFNEAVRRHVLGAEDEIESGDMLMVVRNNYSHKDDERIDFIANGDTARLTRIRRFENIYGFRFAEARLEFPDYDDVEIEGKVLLDTLAADTPSLSREDGSRLFYAIAEDYPEIKNRAKRNKLVMESPYYNALQVKFAYAVTCHKAQGGQWSAVFIDRMLFGDEPMSRDLMRWLYTAITRATERLYFVNFDERFFEHI